MFKTALITIVVCVLALFLLVSLMSSNQAGRERRKQEAIRELDRKNAQDAAKATGVASEADRAKAAQRNLDVDQAIANLRSSDRDVLNEAIQKIQIYRACKAVPDLMHVLKESSDDYIAGISAQTIALCRDPSTYDTIVDEFLRRNATPSMISAVGEIDTSDERVPEKLDKLIAEPNQDEDVLKFARRARSQFHLAQNKGN